MKALARSCVLMLLLCSTAAAQEVDVSPFKDCVQYKGWAALSSFQSRLTFYNECFMPVYIRVCVEDRLGNHKLYTSFQRVRTYGWIRINIDQYDEPGSIHFTYDHFLPEVPKPCRSNNDSKNN